MSRDRREEICARLQAIIAGTSGVARAFRNRTEIGSKTETTVVLWDGDEAWTVGPDGKAPDDPGFVPCVLEMSPAIRIVASASAANVGTVLNTVRLKLIGAITRDVTLAEICSTNGGAQYRGLIQQLDRTQFVDGELWLNFYIRYPALDEEL